MVSTRGARWWVIAVFVIALATRLLWRTAFLNVDEERWLCRGADFALALHQRDPSATYTVHHPGVTNMWLVAGALASRYLIRAALPPTDLAAQSADLPSYLHATRLQLPVTLRTYGDVRIVFAAVTAACVAGIYALSRRLFGMPMAALATAILLLEPFFLGYQRLLTTDANQTNFTWLGLLAFLLYARLATQRQRGARFWLLLSGASVGLAVLSKVPALFGLPAFVLVIARLIHGTRSGPTRRRLLLDAFLWAASACLTALLLWPALRVDPMGTIRHLYDGLGGEVEGHRQSFLGQTTLSPGPLFYPVVLAFRLSPLLLLASIVGLAALGLPALRRYLDDRWSLFTVCVNCLVFLVASSLFAAKLDRYMLPLIPGLALLSAAGIWAGGRWLGERGTAVRIGRWGRLSRPGLIFPALLSLVLLLQFLVVLPHAPYYLTYFNPLLGGPARAQGVLMVGNGELLDQAAAWLNEQAAPSERLVSVSYRSAFWSYYDGPAVELFPEPGATSPPWASADYVVLYISHVQRDVPPEAMRYFLPQEPLHVVSAHGVDYARIYRGPATTE